MRDGRDGHLWGGYNTVATVTDRRGEKYWVPNPGAILKGKANEKCSDTL